MSESEQQQMVVSWFRMQYPKEIIFAIPNGSMLGGQNRFKLATKYRKEGLLPGVSDLFIACPKGVYHGMFIEMKDKGKTYSSVSNEQKFFLESAISKGYLCGWAPGFDSAKEKIEDYMNQKKR